MRVIAGTARGVRLVVPKGSAVRPTGDRARETLFNVLAGRLQGAVVLDLFAGSGALGIEALSRGAARATFVERSGAALRALRDNLARTRLRQQARIVATDWRVALRRLQRAVERFDLVLADPPYDAELGRRCLTELGRGHLLAADALVVIEHRKRRAPELPASWTLQRTLRIGDTAMALLQRVAGDSDPC